MANLNVSVLGAAKETYIKQLKTDLTPLIHEGFISLWEDAEQKEKEQGGYNYLRQFQLFLKDIPNWNQSILEDETERILDKVEYLMQLITAIFVSHVKILSSVRLGGDNRNIRIKIPKSDIFIHKVYINAAEMFYYNPYMFKNHFERESYENIREIIFSSIEETIDSMIPISSILKEYLSNVFSGHITEEPKSYEKENVDDIPYSNILSNSDMGLDDNNYSSPDNDQFGTSNDNLNDIIFGSKHNNDDNNDDNNNDDNEYFSSSSNDLEKNTKDPFSFNEDSFSNNNDSFTSNNDSFTSNNDSFSNNNDPFSSNNDDPFSSNETFSNENENSTPNNSDPFLSSEKDDPFSSPEKDDPFSSPEKDDPFSSTTSLDNNDPFSSGGGGFSSGTSDEDPFVF